MKEKEFKEEGLTDESEGLEFTDNDSSKEIREPLVIKYQCRRHGPTRDYVTLGVIKKRVWCLKCLENFFRKSGGMFPMDPS